MGCGASSSGDNSNGLAGISRTTPTRRISTIRPYTYGSEITLATLNQQRHEFWNTRVDGNAHMWQALETAAEALLNRDFALANALLEASNITTPNGSLDICYDERGHEYKVPLYCYANPTELTRGSTSAPATTKMSEAKAVAPLSSAPKPEIIAAPLHLRIRINPGDYNLHVDASTADSISILKKNILELTAQNTNGIPTCEEFRQRIMFMGRELQNAQLLGEAGIDESKVVQVFLRPSK